jgi:GntR family transcriptional regulator
MTDPNALPRYVQIAEMLTRDIAAGRLAHGTRLPPERQLAEELGIAVGTLRRALDQLAEDGLLERVQGSGNYVRAPRGPSGVYGFFRLETAAGGGLPTARILSVTRMAKPAGQPDYGPAAWGHRIRRLRLLDGAPVAVEEIWLDGTRAERLDAADLSESLYLHYRTALNFWIARVEDRVGHAPYPAWTPAALHRNAGPAGHVTRISWDMEGARAEHSRTWYDTTRAAYVARMT